MPPSTISSESLIQKLSNHLDGFVYQCKRTKDGHFSMPFVNEKILEIYQLAPADVLDDASPMFAMTHPDDFARLKSTADVSANTMQPWQCEWRIIRPDGEERWLQGLSTPEIMEDGSTLWTGYIKDVTDYKNLQSMQEMSNAALHTKFNTVPDFIFEMNASGICHLVHAVGPDVLNDQGISYIGQHVSDFLPASASQVLLKAVDEVNETHKPTYRQFHIDFLNSKKWFELSLVQEEAFETSQLYVVLIRDITQQKETAEKLLVNDVAFKQISQGVVVTDLDSKVITINEGFTKNTGYTLAQVKGKNLSLKQGPETDPNTVEAIRKALKTHTTFEGEILNYKSDGTPFWNELTITTIFDDDQTPLYYLGVVKDISEQVKLKQSLEQSRQFLITVIDAVPSKIFWKDRDSNYLGCNQAFARDVNLADPQDIYLKTDFDLWPKASAEEYRNIDAKVMETGVDMLFEEQEDVNIDGQKEWVVKSKVALKNERGEIVGLLGTYDVVTDKREAQHKLQAAKRQLMESTEKYMDLYEFAPVGYMTVDQGGMVTEANWKARALMGFKRKDLGKVRFNNAVVPSDKKIWQAQFATVLSQVSGDELTFELQVLSGDHQTIDLNLVCVHTESAQSEPVIRITMIDMTEKKQAALALAQKEEYQRSLLDNFPYMVWLKDELGRFLTVNQAFLNAASLTTLDDVVNKVDSDIWTSEYADTHKAQDIAVMEQREPVVSDDIVEIHGKQNWFETYKSPVIVNDQVVGTVGFSRDVSDLKKSVLYEKFKSQLLELVVKEDDLHKIYDAITRGVEQLNPEIFCIIALTNEAGTGFDLVSAPSLPSYFYNALTKVKVGLGQGSIGTATFTKERVIIADVLSHPYWAKSIDLARKAGIAASWAEPIIGASGEVYGAFGMYVNKPTTPNKDDLVVIEQAAKLVSIAIERHQSVTTIQRLAYHDVVTGLPNRRAFTERMALVLETEQSRKVSHAMLYLDIDGFKTINDARGHEIGDLLLIEVSKRLKKACMPEDTIARLGDDEYAILLENLPKDVINAAKSAEQMAYSIVKVLNRPFTIEKQKHHMSASVGVNVFKATKAKQNVDEILKQADIAMNQAKEMGGNVFCFFDPKMQARISAKVKLEAELRNAIKLNQLEMYYQVQVDHTGRPFGLEALIRWNHPEHGIILPEAFIALAEDTELILPIGKWILETACAQLKQWQGNRLTRDLTLSVNISAIQFRQDGFVQQVKKCIEKSQIEPGALRLELTESMLIDNVEETVAHMHALGEFGIQFSLDDFGTGYSSLQYLKRLPLYQLKIDRSFVRDIENDTHDRTIVRTIIAMAQSMYISVIAEGVETQAQKELLLTNGCRRYQGFLFGKPMSVNELQAMLENALKARR